MLLLQLLLPLKFEPLLPFFDAAASAFVASFVAVDAEHEIAFDFDAWKIGHESFAIASVNGSWW